MSLDPRASERRARSRSPGRRDDDRDRDRSRARGDERERERSRVRAPSPPSKYKDDDSDYEYEERTTRITREPAIVTAEPRDRGEYGGASQYRPSSPLSGSRADPYAIPGSFESREEVRISSHGDGRGRGDRHYSDAGFGRGKEDYGRPGPPERTRYSETATTTYKYGDSRGEREKEYERDSRRYDDDRHGRERGGSFNISAGHTSISGGIDIKHRRDSRDDSPPARHPLLPDYAQPKPWEYGQPDEKITYTKRESYSTRPASPPETQYNSSSRSRQDSSASYRPGKSYNDDPRSSKTKIVTVEPGSRNRRDASPGPSSLAPRMHSLSVSSGHHGSASLSLANAPGSPLLESYHGTYQSISPMPSPLMIASTAHSDVNFIEALSPNSSGDEGRGGKKSRRTARFHDPEEEASKLAKALRGDKHGPDTGPLIEILPGLTHEQILDLRVEYKKIVKTGSEKKGVNIAKHIKLRLKEDSHLMKACYACALGKWESEAYWANFWYQGEKSRRELLIESLMGRTNREIRAIKDGFSDKKYSDSLTKCMKTELKEDKFKKAVLMVLAEEKMDDRGSYLDRGLVEDDVRDLHKAVRSEKGGESSMIGIIVVRSDDHLREVLRVYESTYRANFAREMLKKSGNLVGELLTHILNGVINKPVRDALLIHHALSLSKSDSLRTELLISRLVRYHWDRPHLEAVKREYRSRYGVDMQVAVREGTRGEWGRFCEMLCVRRMGDEVRTLQSVEIRESKRFRD